MKIPTRIVVIGTCGAGKTALSKSLSRLLKLPHVELDELYWAENWVRVSDAQFRDAVAENAATQSWIMDGNCSAVRDLIWSRADTIIWLDYSFALIMRRLILRSVGRILARTRIWHGNEETWARLFSKDSIIWWGVSTFARRRRDFEKLWDGKESGSTDFLRFANPDQVDEWLRQLEQHI